MGYINQLSDDLIKQIAAGEVIERPASVVKELVENSIDSKAKRIEIEVIRGGKSVKISDDGTGIHSDDIHLLFSRHATSKIKSINDLWGISSLGFRGEALASISAVSKIICRSKHENQDTGFEIQWIENKMNKKSSPVSIGTVFEVSDLFYNIPAREKFLKSEQTEVGHIFDVVLSEALSHSSIAFKLLNNNNNLLQTSGSGDSKQAICELLGEDLKDNLIPVIGKNGFFEFSGLISTLEVYRSNRKSLFTFIDSRPIKCPILSKAILSAYEGLIPPGKFPIVVLNLKFQPGFVDVNVHPSKREVRYKSSTEMYNLILRTLQKAISDYYKESYKEKSVYKIAIDNEQETTDKRQQATGIETSEYQNISTSAHRHIGTSYSQAAFDLYEKQEPGSKRQEKEGEESNLQLGNSLFSAQNLSCKVLYSNKPIANMVKVGNKTIFEVGTIFDDNVQIVFSGEASGGDDYKKELFNHLANLSTDIYKMYLKNKKAIQKQIVQCEADEPVHKKQRKKPPMQSLRNIWERDNWTCVYCSKPLIDPEVAQEATKTAKNAFITYISNKGDKVTNHVVLEHLASYDHLLPVSKLPQFNFDEDNVYACCVGCNREKSDSMELSSWVPVRKNAWKSPLEIAGLTFKDFKTFSVAV